MWPPDHSVLHVSATFHQLDLDFIDGLTFLPQQLIGDTMKKHPQRIHCRRKLRVNGTSPSFRACTARLRHYNFGLRSFQMKNLMLYSPPPPKPLHLVVMWKVDIVLRLRRTEPHVTTTWTKSKQTNPYTVKNKHIRGEYFIKNRENRSILWLSQLCHTMSTTTILRRQLK